MDQNTRQSNPSLESRSLKDLLRETGEASMGIRVRYIGWDHHHKFFTPAAINQETETIEGQLDCGEKVSFPLESGFWVLYEEGMENAAKAI